MISSLRGTVLAISGSHAVIEVGGVGMSVHITPRHGLSLRLGAETFVHTTLIVREDDLSLFGFAETEELEVFDHLRSVTGVGPKSAMGVLAVLTPFEISRAIAMEDDGAFRKVSGIGPKTAKLIVISLAGKIAVTAASAPVAMRAEATLSESVLVALIGLGWPERIAAQALDDAIAGSPESERTTVPSLLRLALTNLGPSARSGESR